MAIDKSKYISQFVEESSENISIAESLLFEIKDGNAVQENLVTLLRVLHTVKGASRMLEFKAVESLVHSLESAFIAIKEERVPLDDNAVRLFLAVFDELRSDLALIKSEEPYGEKSGGFIAALDALGSGKEFPMPGKDAPPQEPVQPEPDLPDQRAETQAAARKQAAPPPEPEKTTVKDEAPADEAGNSDAEQNISGIKIDRAKLTALFAEEGSKNLSSVETLLFEIKAGGAAGAAVQDDIAKLLRFLHSIKNSAKILNFNRIETLADSLEKVFVSLKEERIALNDRSVKLILAAIDAVKNGIEKIKNSGKDNISPDLLKKELLALSANEDFAVPGEEDGQKKKVNAIQAAGAKRDKLEEAKAESIRISMDRIDEIIRNMAALQSLEISARNIARDTEAVINASRHFSRLITSDQAWNSPLLQEFRAMDLLVSKQGSLVKNYAVDVGNYIRNAYDSVISLRMIPLSTVLDAYPRFVFTISSELGKKAKIRIEGADNEIDKNLIESLSEVFLHMIRNSIDHGIETPEERIAKGKNETGLIVIRCVRESGNMKVTISDDGRGIDTEGIRRKIVRQDLVAKEAAAALSEEELINFIFQSGFSTAEKLSNVSGRGVGMDAVRNNIERMKGSIAIQSKTGEGTVFTVSVPLSMAALMGFPIAVGEMKFIIPANFVDTVLLINTKEIITVVDRPGIKYNGRIIKLFYLHHILKIQENDKRTDADSIFVVIVQAYEETVAIAVNSINSMRQVILKTMPSFMEYIDMFSGVVLNEDYEMVPVLHIPTIIKMARRTKTIDMKKRHVDYERLRKSILVVDDSKPTRDIECDILETEGYRVDIAADGSEALAAAKNTHYDLICTDIEMPNMDGFMLTENIRKNDSLKDIPIIIISSKTDAKDQNRASNLGANRYIVKSSFNNHHLLAAVHELIGEANE